MPTQAEHLAALNRARAAGDKEAVAEIQATLRGDNQATRALPLKDVAGAYDKAKYQKAMGRALEAQDQEAAIEIANDWMDAADAAGKRSPMQYEPDELFAAVEKADKAGDMEGIVLLGAAAKRRGLKPKNLLDKVADGASGVVNAVGAIPGAVQSGVDNFGRGVSRLASGEASLQDLGAAIADNVATAAEAVPGADLVAAGAGNIVNFVEGDENNPNLVQERRDIAAQAAERNPLAAAAGELAGAGAVANRVLKVPGLAVAPANGVVNNVLRTAVAGAASEGAVGLADTLDPGEAARRAAVGAVVAPVASAVVKKTLDIAAPSARAITGRALPAGFKKLSQIVKVPAAELERTFNALKQVRGGQNPSIAEVVDTATIQRAQSVINSQPVVARAAEAADDAAELARPARGAAQVANGQRTAPAAAPRNSRTRSFTRMMDTHGRRPVRIDNPAYFDRPAVRTELRALVENSDPADQAILQGFMESLDDGLAASIRLRDLEAVRNTISAAIDRNPNLTRTLGPVRDTLERIGASQVNEYGLELGTFRRLGDIAEGIEIGNKAVKGSTADLQESMRSTPPGADAAARRDGAAIGMRTRLSEDVGNSYGSSGRAMDSLQSPGLRERVAEVSGQVEADRLADLGRLEGQAARNLAALNPAPNPRATAPTNDLQLAGDVAALAKGAGAGFIANTINALMQRFSRLGMSQRSAEGLARGLFDPAQSQRAIDTLKRIGVWEEAKALLAQQAGVTQAGMEGNE